MLSAKKVHLKIVEISDKLVIEAAPIYVNWVVAELKTTKEELLPYLFILEVLNIIHFKEKSEDIIFLTESGKLANI